ncbi:MAG: hypothetical protein AB8I08_27410 [Sandaracinaceae bacterium]
MFVRLHVLMVVSLVAVLFGCARTTPPADATPDGGESDAGFAMDCIEGPTQLVLGEELGCATAELLGDGPARCGTDTDDPGFPVGGIPASGVRIVNRGSHRVRVSITAECVEGEDCAFDRDDPTTGGVFRTASVGPDEISPSCGLCERGIGRIAPDTPDAVSVYLPFSVNFPSSIVERPEFAVEYYLAGENLRYTVEACTFESSELRDQHQRVCLDGCSRSARSVPCADYCSAVSDIEDDSCLRARIEATECLIPLVDEGVFASLDPDERPGLCPEPRARVAATCRASWER